MHFRAVVLLAGVIGSPAIAAPTHPADPQALPAPATARGATPVPLLDRDTPSPSFNPAPGDKAAAPPVPPAAPAPKN